MGIIKFKMINKKTSMNITLLRHGQDFQLLHLLLIIDQQNVAIISTNIMHQEVKIRELKCKVKFC